MRRLNDPSGSSARTARRDRADRGGVTLFVVLMMPLLVFFGAFVFDGGRGIVARRETQNAADAGALAKATDCAKKIETTDFVPYQTNGASLANAPTCEADGTTTVFMTKTIDLVFWPTPGGDSRDVTRSATAKWGTLGSANTIPITISSCEFSLAILDGTTDIYLYLDDPKPQSGCSSLPGGFSQLRDNDCSVPISAGGTAAGDPGGDLMKAVPCIVNPTAPALPSEVLIPIYDAPTCNAADCKGKGPYPITGFAVFRVSGYSFNGNKYAGAGMTNKCPDDKDRGKYCIRGDFVRFVTSQGTPGSSTDFGVTQVFLIT